MKHYCYLFVGAVAVILVATIFLNRCPISRECQMLENAEVLTECELITSVCAYQPDEWCSMVFVYDDGHIESEYWPNQINTESLYE